MFFYTQEEVIAYCEQFDTFNDDDDDVFEYRTYEDNDRSEDFKLKRYYDENKRLHKEDGPASVQIFYLNGTDIEKYKRYEWYENGKCNKIIIIDYEEGDTPEVEVITNAKHIERILG